MRWRRGAQEAEPEAPVLDEAAPASGEPTDGPAATGEPFGDAPATAPAEDDSYARREPAPSLPPPPAFEIDPDDLARATRRAVARALTEDLGDRGDVTSLACVPAGTTATGRIVARGPGVVSGVDTVRETFAQVDARVEVAFEVADGDAVNAGATLATVTGPLRSILTAERTALNFLGHLSGIATATARCVAAVAGTGAAVRDTRKTTPGLRLMEKAAVVAGGGTSHRLGLHDALLVKDNHAVAAGGVGPATAAALARADGRGVQVEVTDLDEIDAALAAGATDLLLDNFDPHALRAAVAHVAGRAHLEASGRIDAGNARAYAETGVDRLAIGHLTHSAPALDVALDISPLVGQAEPGVSAGEPLNQPEPAAAAGGAATQLPSHTEEVGDFLRMAEEVEEAGPTGSAPVPDDGGAARSHPAEPLPDLFGRRGDGEQG